MPAYLVLPLDEPGASISLAGLGPATAWCEQQATGQRYKIVAIPNENGKLPAVDVAAMHPVHIR
jgi:hypothetical protein